MLPSGGAVDNDSIDPCPIQGGLVVVFIGEYDVLPVVDDPDGVLGVPRTDDDRFAEREFRDGELPGFGEKLQSSEDHLVEVRDVGFAYLGKSIEIFGHGSRG